VVVGDFNTPLSTKIGYPDQKEKNQRNLRIKGKYRSNIPGTPLQSIPSCNSTIYILLSSP
jgi:hypothetical protein